MNSKRFKPIQIHCGIIISFVGCYQHDTSNLGISIHLRVPGIECQKLLIGGSTANEVGLLHLHWNQVLGLESILQPRLVQDRILSLKITLLQKPTKTIQIRRLLLLS